VNARKKLPNLAIKRGTSKTTTKTEVTYTKGWSEGRKRAGERLRIAAKKASIAMASKASTPINKQEHKRKATGERDVCSQSGSIQDRFTKLMVEDHGVAVRVPKYIVSELEQSQGGEQDLDWMLGVVQRSYIDLQSNARMYDVLFADGNSKCIPSGFTEHILRHENNSIQPTKNVEATCNISSDDESEDEEGIRDGDDCWPCESPDDIHEQATEWAGWAERLENVDDLQQQNATNLQQSKPTRMVGSGRIPAVTEKSEAPGKNTAVASLRSKSVGDGNGYHKVGQKKRKPKMGRIEDVPGRTVRLRSAKMNAVKISDHRLPAICNGSHKQKQKPAQNDGCGDVPRVAGMQGLGEPNVSSISPLRTRPTLVSPPGSAKTFTTENNQPKNPARRGACGDVPVALESDVGDVPAAAGFLGCSAAATTDNNPNNKTIQNSAVTIDCGDVPAAASVERLGFAATARRGGCGFLPVAAEFDVAPGGSRNRMSPLSSMSP
jgi:hypothetical protein